MTRFYFALSRTYSGEAVVTYLPDPRPERWVVFKEIASEYRELTYEGLQCVRDIVDWLMTEDVEFHVFSASYVSQTGIIVTVMNDDVAVEFKLRFT